MLQDSTHHELANLKGIRGTTRASSDKAGHDMKANASTASGWGTPTMLSMALRVAMLHHCRSLGRSLRTGLGRKQASRKKELTCGLTASRVHGRQALNDDSDDSGKTSTVTGRLMS